MKIDNKQELDIIRANAELPVSDILNILRESGFMMSATSVEWYLRRLHTHQKKCSDIAIATVDKTIDEFMSRNATKYLQMLDENIEQISRILRDEDPEISLRDESGRIDRKAWGKYSKLLGEQVRTTLGIRPLQSTDNNTRTNINVNVDMPLDDLLEKYYNEYKINKATKINDDEKDNNSDLQFVES